jgi:hypothetical protein
MVVVVDVDIHSVTLDELCSFGVSNKQNKKNITVYSIFFTLTPVNNV